MPQIPREGLVIARQKLAVSRQAKASPEMNPEQVGESASWVPRRLAAWSAVTGLAAVSRLLFRGKRKRVKSNKGGRPRNVP
jgi:hypothetical protein